MIAASRWFARSSLLRSRRVRLGNWLIGLALGIGLYTPAALAQSALKLVTPQPATAAPAPAVPTTVADLAIPLTQVADQAEQLDRKLEAISRDLKNAQDEVAPEQTVAEQSKQIEERAEQLDSFLQELTDNLQLRDESVYWRALARQSAEARKQVSARAVELQNQVLILDEEETRWQATQAEIRETEGIAVVAARVQQELAAIASVRLQAQDELNRVLIVQNKLSRTSRLILDSIAKLNEAEEQYRSHLFERDSPPLWAMGSREANQRISMLLHSRGDQDFKTAAEFLRAMGSRLLAIPIFYLLGLWAAFRIRRYLNSAPRPGVPSEAYEILRHPYSLAALGILLVSLSQIDAAPLSITLVFHLLWLFVVFRLGSFLAPPRLHSILYTLLIFNLIELLRDGIPLPALLGRAMLSLVPLAALAAFAWLERPSRPQTIFLSDRAERALRITVWIGLALLFIGAVANIFGYVALSHLLGVGTVQGALFGLAYYCVARVAFLLLLIFLDSEWAADFSPELHHSIQVWGRRALAVLVLWFWCTRYQLYIFLFRQTMSDAVSGVLDYSLGFGKVHFTIGAIVSVALILVVGYGLAKGTAAILRSILLAKLPLRRGLPYAISKVTYYALMIMVLAAAVTTAGVELNKFTVITGAIGVGVGFGLQNIINNFASGLILLFERPVRVGDTVEVNNLVGTVRRIGARSSTIGTAQGAEVIVPNNNLISNQVINWTLSSPWRRVEIPVGVAYGSDPERVLKLLYSIAIAHPDVMRVPPPEAFFLGFGDSALNFELRFWAPGQDTWFRLKSDVTIGVSRALAEAGIEIPFPQRDLHLRSTDVPLAGLAAVNPQIDLKPAAPIAGSAGKTELSSGPSSR